MATASTYGVTARRTSTNWPPTIDQEKSLEVVRRSIERLGFVFLMLLGFGWAGANAVVALVAFWQLVF